MAASSKLQKTLSVAKRSPAKKAVPAKKAAPPHRPKGKVISSAPIGYAASPNGLVFVPESTLKSTITPASKLRQGMIKAQAEIRESLQEIAATLSMDFEISEIELSVSFNADGKFLGFGVGGATSLKIKIKPTRPSAA